MIHLWLTEFPEFPNYQQKIAEIKTNYKKNQKADRLNSSWSNPLDSITGGGGMTHFCPFKAIDTIWGTRLLRALQVKGRGDIRRQAWVVLCSGTEVNREKCGVMLESVIIRLTSEENFSI